MLPRQKYNYIWIYFKSNLFCFGDQFLYNTTLMAFLGAAKISNLAVGCYRSTLQIEGISSGNINKYVHYKKINTFSN